MPADETPEARPSEVAFALWWKPERGIWWECWKPGTFVIIAFVSPANLC
jgi:hypothetical protein